MYKYFAWKDGAGRWGGGNLLSGAQFSSLKKLLPSSWEQFETVQNHTEDGRITDCPIFADFDHRTDLELARKDTIAFTQTMQYHLGVTPELYFSGTKGFHAIVPYDIQHPRCHLIVKGIIDELQPKLSTLDTSVYRSKSLLRILNSPASKPGTFKVKITKNQLFNEDGAKILAFARTKRTPTKPDYDASKINQALIQSLVKEIDAKLGTLKEYDQQAMDMTPCIQTLLYEGVPEGQRNRAVFILAKFFKINGVSMEDTLDRLLSYPHFREWEETKSVKLQAVLSSVFRNRMSPSLGCKTGVDGEILRDYCSDLCIFSDKFPDLHIGASRDANPKKDTPESGPVL